MITCNKCRVEKPYDQFALSKKSKDATSTHVKFALILGSAITRQSHRVLAHPAGLGSPPRHSLGSGRVNGQQYVDRVL